MKVGEENLIQAKLECSVCHTLLVDVGLLITCVTCRTFQCTDPFSGCNLRVAGLSED